MAKTDLFDDTTMTFGEHLEVLRVHLWRAIVGLLIGTAVAFFFSRDIIIEMQKPVNEAMAKVFIKDINVGENDKSQWDSAKDWTIRTYKRIRGQAVESPEDKGSKVSPPDDPALFVRIDARDVMRQLHKVAPDNYAAPPDNAELTEISIPLAKTKLGEMLIGFRTENMKPRTDGPDEAFMIYMKVSLIVGAIISSPWIFFQIWQFVAAGLYANERKYVYTYLPMSLVLFLGGAAFCFFAVIPTVLKFLFEFNEWLKIRPEIRVSTWITFALVVSLMFGLSFQLPLVMLFLERISLVTAQLYREKRRFAILIIAFLSMVLTPSDPVSMMLMMIPLCVLYEFGILLCGRGTAKLSPFGAPST